MKTIEQIIDEAFEGHIADIPDNDAEREAYNLWFDVGCDVANMLFKELLEGHRRGVQL